MRTITPLVLLLICFVASARAAEVHLDGTPGASVRIDGELVGMLPLDEQLEPGDYSLQVSLAGYRTHRAELSVAASGLSQLEIWLLPLQPRTAAVASLVLAGAGQIYSGRPRAGYAFLGLQLTAAIGTAFLESEYKQRREDYQRAQIAYSEAIAPAEIAELRLEVEDKWKSLDDLKPLRDGFLASIFAVAVVSAVEAWWHFPDLELQAQPSDDGVQVGLGGSF